MQYYGTSDRLGKAYHVFMDSEHNLLVTIPADVQTRDQAALSFQSGWASAFATHGLLDGAKQSFQKQKPRNEGDPWIDDPFVTPVVGWSAERISQSYGLPRKVVPGKDGSKSWVYEWNRDEGTLLQLTVGFNSAGNVTLWVMSQIEKRHQ